MNVITGQIVGALDRQLGGCVRQTLQDVFSCFEVGGFIIKDFLQAMRSVKHRHPYLAKVLDEAVHFRF